MAASCRISHICRDPDAMMLFHDNHHLAVHSNVKDIDEDVELEDDATDEKIWQECEEEKRRRLKEQFVWPDSPRLS